MTSSAAGLVRRVLLCSGALVAALLSQPTVPCEDQNADCGNWAKAGECNANPGYMKEKCPVSCNSPCGPPPSPSKLAWELENLEAVRPESAVVELSHEDLLQRTAKWGETELMIVWFYAPWCKQCKLCRPHVEEAARRGVAGASFGRIDATRFPDAKKAFGVGSYPSFMAVRPGGRRRWLDAGKERGPQLAQILVDLATDEIEGGGYRLLESAQELRAFVFEQLAPFAHRDPDEDRMFFAGRGEAAAIAVLPDPSDDSAARGGLDPDECRRRAAAFATLATNSSLRLSPFPFGAVRYGDLLLSAGLPSVPPGHVAVIKMFQEQFAEDDTAESSTAPQVVAAPLDADPLALRHWLLGQRLPLAVDFLEDRGIWTQRARGMVEQHAHLLLFVTPGRSNLIREVRRAVSRFRRGSVALFFFTPKSDDELTPLHLRYGVNSLLDLPHLVMIDLTLTTEDRQVRYTGGPLSEASVTAFLRERNVPEGEAFASLALPLAGAGGRDAAEYGGEKGGGQTSDQTPERRADGSSAELKEEL